MEKEQPNKEQISVSETTNTYMVTHGKHANPTKMLFASRALHVIASLELFNDSLAMRIWTYSSSCFILSKFISGN